MAKGKKHKGQRAAPHPVPQRMPVINTTAVILSYFGRKADVLNEVYQLDSVAGLRDVGLGALNPPDPLDIALGEEGGPDGRIFSR